MLARTLGKMSVSGLALARLLEQSSACFASPYFTCLISLLHRTLASAFPDAALGVSVGVDGVVFQSDVYAASNSGTLPKRHVRNHWGDRAVLILVGIRLGLDGVNPIYYDSIKVRGVTP